MKTKKLIEKQQLSSYEKEFTLIMNNARFRKVFSYLSNNKNRGKFLDIGCSGGEFAALVKTLGFDVYGLELSKKGVKDSLKKGIKAKEYNFVEGLPYKKNEFDFIFAGEVIEHTIDDSFFLSECNRILKKEGVLILTTPNLVSLGNRLLMLLGFMPRFAYQEFHYRIYNYNLLKNKLRKAGFDIKKVSSGHVLISTYFNKYLGIFGELLADIYPKFGEQFIIYAQKKVNS